MKANAAKKPPTGMATIKKSIGLMIKDRKNSIAPPLASQRNCFRVSGPISFVSTSMNCGTWKRNNQFLISNF